MMKNTILFDKHLEYNGKMVPFAGYNMPVQFEGVNIEHLRLEIQLAYLMYLTWENF